MNATKSEAVVKKKIGGLRFIETKSGTYAMSMGQEMEQLFSLSGGSIESDPVTVAGIRVVPWGMDNNLPAYIRDLLDKNNLAPGILEREMGLTYGQGPELYRKVERDGEIVREYVLDKQIQEWLESWDYKQFVRDAITEYKYMRGFFAKYISGRSVRLGKPWISRLEISPCHETRMEWVDTRRMNDVKNIIVGDFENYRNNLRRYPRFEKLTPARAEVAIDYHSFRSFARNFYSFPSFFGTIPWIRRSNDIPDIIEYLTNNMIAAAYHVHQPEAYWEKKKENLMEMYPEWDEGRIAKRMAELQDEMSATIANVLAGKRNAGKFLTTVDVMDNEGNLQMWKVEPINMNIKDYIDAQVKISQTADSATTSGIGLHPSLSNIIIGGQLNSGSQMLYALKLYLASDTNITEDIIFEPINVALKINFPDKHLKMGFYHKVVMKEENVSPEDRVTNNA